MTFSQAVEHHLTYLKKVEDGINGTSDYCAGSHLNCKLGSWLYGIGALDVKKYGSKAEIIFTQLFEPHKKFHRNSVMTIEAFNNKEHKQAKRALTDMLMASRKLIKLLEQLRKLTE